MAGFDFTPFAVGGATRPDSFSGLDAAFADQLAQMFQAAPPEIQRNLRVMSGFRSVDRQRQLWENALAKYGSPAAARKWVAPPGHSNHNKGHAVDLKYLDPSATTWAHQNAAKYGLNFPLSNEDWHIEPIGARGGQGHGHAMSAAPAFVPPDGPKGQEVYAPPIDAAPAGPEGPPQSPLGAMMAGFASGFGGTGGGGQSADAGQPRVIQDGGFGATMAAQQGADQAKQLAFGLSPDIEKMLALAPKPFARKGAALVG